MKSKNLLRIFALFLAMLMLSACTGGSKAPKDSTGKYFLNDRGEAIINDVAFPSDPLPEDNYRVFYEIFVGSFSDSDGDGIGDLRGIINRMDYLNDGDPTSGTSLGVEGIWLTPIFKSISYHKYDVMDYYTIDPKFGTMEDLKELIELCHSRGVKLILDLVINHTSSLNPMFVSFMNAHRANDTQDPYYDFYCYYHAGEAAPAGKTFAQLSGTTDYYECNFSGDMPELNYDNDAVRQTVLDIAKFYLDMGIDGFRFDAAKYIYYGDNARSAQFWDWYIGELKKIKPDIYTVAEVWDGDGVTEQYFPILNCFNFTTSQAGGLIAQAAKGGDAGQYTSYVQSYLASIRKENKEAMPVPFISNHDMDRAAGYLSASNGTMQMAANLYILSAGSPFLYYGEEIGIKGSRGGASTDANRRLAMVWSDEDTIQNPTGSTYRAESQLQDGVAVQIGQGDSLFSYYKRLIMIRSANPEIARGEYKALSISGKAGGFTSTWNGSTVAVIHNPTEEEVTVDLSGTGFSPEKIAAAIGMNEAKLEGTTLTLGAQTSVVLR